MATAAAGPPTDPGTSRDDAQALRSRMRADLRSAMKARRTEAVSALRTTLAAFDNAEGVAPPTPPRRRRASTSPAPAPASGRPKRPGGC